MGGFGSYFTKQAQGAQQSLPQNMQMQPGQQGGMDMPRTGGIKPAPGGYNPTQFGYNPNMQRGPAPFQASFPPFGGTGYGGRYGGAMFGGNPYGGYFGGGSYGMGGFPRGYGMQGYGPGSYGMGGMMGYGGGSGMFGGPQRGYAPFGGPMNWARSQVQGGPMGGPMRHAPIRPGQAIPGQGYNPMDVVRRDRAAQKAAEAKRKAEAKKKTKKPWWMTRERCCFIEGTLIKMHDGRQVPIENIKVGDVLYAHDGDPTTVMEIHTPKLGNRMLYSINKGQHFVTAEHPFYTTEGWKSFSPNATAEENPDLEVGKLWLGDQIMRLDGSYETVETVGTTTAHPGTQLYNFTLDGDHTYHADGYLVHNKGGDGPGGGPAGGGGGASGGGTGGGCFAFGTLFEMADGTFKAIQDMQIGDKTRGGEVTDLIRGKSDRQWYDYFGTHVTDEHFVLEGGVWKYVKDSDKAFPIEGYDQYYTMNVEDHLLYGENEAVFSDDAVFDIDHKPEWDAMLEVLNDGSSEKAG